MTPVNTEILFRLLLRRFQPGIVCDVGSMDGRDAIRFRRILPSADIVAFEANPRNFGKMARDARLSQAGIRLVNKAVSDQDGKTFFHIEALAEAGEEWRRGSSSMLTKLNGSLGADFCEVETVRLDTYLAAGASAPSIALWVDAEGAAYEVLASMRGIKGRVKFVHVEVESQELWKGQKLERDVDTLMASMGFARVAQRPLKVQYDVVYVNEEGLDGLQATVGEVVRKAKMLGWMRKRGGRILGNLILRMNRV